MTTALVGKDVAARLAQQFPTSVVSSDKDYVLVKPEAIREVISFLKTAPDFEFDYLNDITAADYFDYFEVVYHLTSMKHNKSLVIRARCPGRENLVVPSIVSLYRGADLQEREVYDMLGITFEGHPNLTRILTWDGFQGHPLRKDYL